MLAVAVVTHATPCAGFKRYIYALSTSICLLSLSRLSPLLLSPHLSPPSLSISISLLSLSLSLSLSAVSHPSFPLPLSLPLYPPLPPSLSPSPSLSIPFSISPYSPLPFLPVINELCVEKWHRAESGKIFSQNAENNIYIFVCVLKHSESFDGNEMILLVALVPV